MAESEKKGQVSLHKSRRASVVSCLKAMPRKSAQFARKYFWEGQKTTDEIEAAAPVQDPEEDGTPHWFIRYRRLLGFVLPGLFWHAVWWPIAIKHNLFAYFPSRWPISLTMVFGAMVAGATSEGGGAVAFPVMTMAFKILPNIARDFSLMIQSAGMTAAAFTILWMKLKLEMSSVIFSSLGAIFGLAFSLEFLDHRITPPQKKMGFVSVFFPFAFALFLLNRRKKRPVMDHIPFMSWWKRLVLLGTGFIGGTMTGLVGSGVDIVSFSVLTLLFSVSEKVATPTSVVLMAINTAVGFYWRGAIQGDISDDAWGYLAVCVPIVVICAPFGSLLASHFHRLVLAALIYILETVSILSAFIIIKPGLWLTLASIGLLVVSAGFFYALSVLGLRLLAKEQEKASKQMEISPTAMTEISNGKSVTELHSSV